MLKKRDVVKIDFDLNIAYEEALTRFEDLVYNHDMSISMAKKWSGLRKLVECRATYRDMDQVPRYRELKSYYYRKLKLNKGSILRIDTSTELEKLENEKLLSEAYKKVRLKIDEAALQKTRDFVNGVKPESDELPMGISNGNNKHCK